VFAFVPANSTGHQTAAKQADPPDPRSLCRQKTGSEQPDDAVRRVRQRLFHAAREREMGQQMKKRQITDTRVCSSSRP